MSDRLAAKVALVIGGSRGIGRAIALRLARDGADVAITYARNAEAARSVVAEVQALGKRGMALPCDLMRIETIPPVFQAVIDGMGPLDILVNNAGVGVGGPFAATTEQAYDGLFAVTKGVFFSLKEAAGVLAPNGRIINFSTGLTRNWAPQAAAYAGSKAAVEQFTRSLSKELGPRGITVNVVLPGVIETDMTAAMPIERKEQSRQQTSLGRLGQPEDIADVVAFLASHDARWITGQLIVANGGSTP
ncbi:SDR family oxidoreductase [Zavarzinia sp. CC-PAN008]|uniref:SDR family oxidoreductase n=1 Tax=Zavarzinia sp. CC-PAN008 TaxID=3243332 RepID=UPI003F7470EC